MRLKQVSLLHIIAMLMFMIGIAFFILPNIYNKQLTLWERITRAPLSGIIVTIILPAIYLIAEFLKRNKQ